MPYLYITLSCLCWVYATQNFSQLAREIGVWNLNFYKTLIALVFFVFTIWFLKLSLPEKPIILTLLLSGFIGYVLGDFCLLKAMSKIGATNTLMLNPFSPAFLSVLSFFFLDLTMSSFQVMGLILIFPSLYFLSLDKNGVGEFQWPMALLGLLGLFFDAIGVIITKSAFIGDATLSPFMAITIRISSGFLFYILFKSFKFKSASLSLKNYSKNIKIKLVVASLVGTYLSLALLFLALKELHPAVVASFALLSPLLSSIYEYTSQKKRPTLYFMLSFAFMSSGLILISIL
jgi:drug/metabolite transporter (DMT)-like permease